MARTIGAVIATMVTETPMVGFGFMAVADIPTAMYGFSSIFGVITLKDKPDNYVDPFRLARGEAGAIGSDGLRRWNLNVFQSPQGMIIGFGVDDDSTPNRYLAEFLADDKLPDCILLMDEATFIPFKEACDSVGIRVIEHHYEGELMTSYKSLISSSDGVVAVP